MRPKCTVGVLHQLCSCACYLPSELTGPWLIRKVAIFVEVSLSTTTRGGELRMQHTKGPVSKAEHWVCRAERTHLSPPPPVHRDQTHPDMDRAARSPRICVEAATRCPALTTPKARASSPLICIVVCVHRLRRWQVYGHCVRDVCGNSPAKWAYQRRGRGCGQDLGPRTH